MKLIGMLDSPYVRRVAVSLALYGVEFEHLPLSVFSAVEPFSKINPVVKAPTLILDNAVRLMDSTLILHYFESRRICSVNYSPSPALRWPKICRSWVDSGGQRKAVQHVYEHRLRPPEKQYQPWIERITGSCCLPAGNGTLRWNTARSTRGSIRSR